MYKTVAPGCLGFGKSFKEAAQPVAESGFEGFWFGIETDSKVPLSETQELLSQYQLRAAGFNLPLEFRKDQSLFEEGLAKLPAYAEYAEKIGANRCITWILPSSETLDYNANFEFHRSRLTKVAEILKAYGILFGLEFISPRTSWTKGKHPFIHGLSEMLNLCEAIGTGNCGILMDSWHWDLAGQTLVDFKKFQHADQIVLVHINDAPAGVSPEDQIDSVRKLPGETGVLRIADFFKGLQSVGYEGPVLPEPFEPKLREMTFEKALETAKAAVDKVWPL